jgi:putative tryptophan/tyrosine transport system substrate-binding protein
MRRRQFIAGLGGAVALPLAARAQPAGRIPTIGVLWHAASPSEEQPYFDALLQGFKELGYVEGRNIKFEHRFPNEIPERFRQMAAELASLNVAAIVTVGNTTAPYAKQATSTIPIVFVFVNDPVGMKLINTLARPGGNITGQSVVGIDLTAKRFELLREIVPQVSRVGLLFNPAEPSGPQYLAEGKAAAAALGLTVLPFELGALNEMESVFARMVQAEVQALALGPGGLLFQGKENLAKLALAHRMPACGWSRETLLSGLLLSYGPDLVQIVRQAATFVDKILHGAKPGDIPVQQPTRFQLIVNQRTAKALNINIPASFFLRSDEVVE